MRETWLFAFMLLAAMANAFRAPYFSSARSKLPMAMKAEDANNGAGDKKKFSVSQLIQLVTMGAGAPSLGEYKSTDENGRMFFELDANKFNGGVPSGKYVDSGYVDEKDDKDQPPGFWKNLISGGKLQTEYENRLKK